MRSPLLLRLTRPRCPCKSCGSVYWKSDRDTDAARRRNEFCRSQNLCQACRRPRSVQPDIRKFILIKEFRNGAPA